MNSPPTPVKIHKTKNNTCARILTPLQVGPICWFMATFVAMFYSQRSRKLLLAASSSWYKKKELFTLLKHVLDDKYLKTASGRESDDYRNFKEDTFMNILKLMNKEDKKAFPFNPSHKTMLNSYRPQLYIGKLYKLLGVNYKMFDCSTTDYTLRYSYLNEDYNALRISKIVDNNIIDDIDNSQGRLKDYKYIDDRTAPPILIVRFYNYHIPIYDNILTNNVIPEEDKNSNIKYRKDNITYNGKKYTLDSATITNTNTEHKVGHIISGITCKKERYVYNGWPRINMDPAKATRDLTQNIPCELMKWNWNTVYDANICLNRKSCMPDILKGEVEKGNVCFSFSRGSRILVYVRDDAKSATSSSHSPDRSPAKAPVKARAKTPAKSPAKSPKAVKSPAKSPKAVKSPAKSPKAVKSSSKSPRADKSPASPIRKKQPSKKATATVAPATPPAVAAATARAARAAARAARAAATT
jgi:hypothetical protein